jgi:replication factor A1
MNREEVIRRILSACSEVSREQVLDRLESEKKKTGGLISEEALLRVIAAGFGCDVRGSRVLISSLSLGDLVPNLGDVTVVGRVAAVFSPRSFSGKRSGRFASLLIADESGVLRVVLWNDRAGLAEPGGVKAGDVVRFRHGYTREDRRGKVELHVGDRSVVEVSPSDVDLSGFPAVDKFATKMEDLKVTRGGSRVILVGTVRKVFSVSSFDRGDEGLGKVLRFVLAGAGGEVDVVVWNEKVDDVEGLVEVGRGLRVVDGKVRKSAGGGVEVHVDGSTFVEAVAAGFVRLGDLVEGLKHVSVEGEVVARPAVREVRTKRGDVLRVASFELRDESGRVWVSAWRSHVDDAAGLMVGDAVVLKDVYVKRGFGDQLELSTRSRSSIVGKGRKEEG